MIACLSWLARWLFIHLCVVAGACGVIALVWLPGSRLDGAMTLLALTCGAVIFRVFTCDQNKCPTCRKRRCAVNDELRLRETPFGIVLTEARLRGWSIAKTLRRLAQEAAACARADLCPICGGHECEKHGQGAS